MTKRSALPLPRYVRRKPLKDGWGYFFEPPTCARKTGCPVEAEALGTDYRAAVDRAETILLPQLDAWWRGTDAAHAGSTLDWMFAEYRVDRRYAKLDVRTKRNHEVGFRMVGGYVMKDGRKLGTMPLASITTAVIDALYEKLLIIRETDAAGNVIERERRTTVNHAMKSCRRAWNIARRQKATSILPSVACHKKLSPWLRSKQPLAIIPSRPSASRGRSFRAPSARTGWRAAPLSTCRRRRSPAPTR